MNARFFKFIILFALIVVALEIFIRANGSVFFALSDKLLLKVAILERAPDTQVLFLGTSRFVDGIEQNTFTDELDAASGTRFKILNGATTSAKGERAVYIAKIAAANKNLTHVILEASAPTFENRELGFSVLDPNVETLDDNPQERFATRFENRLQNWLTRHVAIMKYRKALRLKTILQLPVLYMADSVDPNIWMRKGIVRNIFSSVDVEITEEIIAHFRPEIITAERIEDQQNMNPSSEAYRNLLRLSNIFAESGIEVIWVAPPVSTIKQQGNYGPEFTQMYQAVANQYGTVFYDYKGLDSKLDLFRDATHLNAKGRRVFSVALARQLAGHFTSRPE